MGPRRGLHEHPLTQRGAFWLVLVVALAACSAGDGGRGATVSDTASGAAAALSAAESGERGQKVLTYQNVTLFVPQTWRLVARGGAAGLGDFAPRPGGRSPRASLTISTGAPGPVDQAAPEQCEGGAAASVDLVEAGFAPVGDQTADFRLWIAACADGTAEQRRAWLLPAARILFTEEYHVPENVTVVTSAQVG
jgi:hypothetical protein